MKTSKSTARNFGKPKLDRADVRAILGISRTTLWRLEKTGVLVPQIVLGRTVRYDYDYIMNLKLSA